MPEQTSMEVTYPTLLHEIFALMGVRYEVEGRPTKSTYEVFFVRDKERQVSYAAKVFPRTQDGIKDYEKESTMHALLSDSQFIVNAIECVGFDKTPVAPAHLTIILPCSMNNEYACILMPKLTNDTLLSFLMRAIHNNGLSHWRKISLRL